MIRHFCLFLLLIFITACQSPASTSDPKNQPHLLAHRGLSQHAPENTLPAFAAAIDLGLDIEVDVFQTLDEHIVVIHDDTLDRTTNGTGQVTEKTLAEIRTLDAGLWFASDYRGLKVPRFEEVLQLVKNNQWRQTKIAINMKVISPGIEERIVRLVEKYNMIEQVFVFGMNFESTTRFRKANQEITLSVPGWTWDKNGDRRPTAEEVKSAHAQGKKVWVISSCINYYPDRWDNARAAGVDGFLTNYPLEARELWRPSNDPNRKSSVTKKSKKEVIAPPKTGPDSRPQTPRPAILSGRGLSKYLPENTLPALAAAVSLGFGVELNVHQTKDSQLVVIHDQIVDRTTNGTGKVSEKTLSELRALDAGSWFDPIFKGFRIPTLEETLEIVQKRQWCPVFVTIKLQNAAPDIETQAISLVEKYKMIEQVVVLKGIENSDKKEEDHLAAWQHALEVGAKSITVSDPLELRRFWNAE